MAEIGTGLLDDVFNFTSCAYTIAFDAVPESAVYVLVPSSGDEPVSLLRADLESAGWQAEIVVNTGDF